MAHEEMTLAAPSAGPLALHGHDVEGVNRCVHCGLCLAYCPTFSILGSIAHIWWYEAVHAVGPSRSAVFMNLQPVAGVLLAWAMLGERITVSGVLGGAAVLVGVALTTRRAPAGRVPPPPAGASRS